MARRYRFLSSSRQKHGLPVARFAPESGQARTAKRSARSGGASSAPEATGCRQAGSRSAKHAEDQKADAHQLDREHEGDSGLQERRNELHDVGPSRLRASELIAANTEPLTVRGDADWPRLCKRRDPLRKNVHAAGG